MTILAIQKRYMINMYNYQNINFVYFFSQNKTKKLSNFFVDYLDLKMTDN